MNSTDTDVDASDAIRPIAPPLRSTPRPNMLIRTSSATFRHTPDPAVINPIFAAYWISDPMLP